MVKTAFIISWFGDKPELRELRKEQHRKQLNSILNQTDWNILIYAQMYDKEDFTNNPRIKYIENNERVLRPNLARNILKKEFYNSNEDYGLFIDDDVIIEKNFVDTLTNKKELLEKAFTDYKIGFISTQFGFGSNSLRLNNAVNTIKLSKFAKEHEDNTILYLADKACPEGLYIMRNFKKMNNIEFYYDNAMKFSMGKDLHCQLLEKGFSIYYFWNLNSDFGDNKSVDTSTIAKYRKDTGKNSEFSSVRRYFFTKWINKWKVPRLKPNQVLYNVQQIRFLLMWGQEKFLNLNKLPYKIAISNDDIVGTTLKNIK